MDLNNKKADSRSNSNEKRPLGLVIALSVAVGAVIGAAVTYSLAKPQPAPIQTTASPTNFPMPQTFTAPPPQQQFTPAAQPPGDAPPGKVWSAEHGHWHDIPGAVTTPAPGVVPPGN